MSLRRFLFQACISRCNSSARHLSPYRYPFTGIGISEPPNFSIQAKLASTRKTITVDNKKPTGREVTDDDDTWNHEPNENWDAAGDEDNRRRQWRSRPNRNTLMTHYALDVISNRDTKRRTDLSIRTKPKNHRNSNQGRAKKQVQVSRLKNVQKNEDDGFGGFEDINGVEDDNGDEDGGDIGSYFRVYKMKKSIGLFMLQSSGYNNSCMVKVLKHQTKSYDAKTDDANVIQLVECCTKNHHKVPSNVLKAGVKSLCKIPADKLDILVGFELPFLLPKVACESVETLTSDVVCDLLLAMICLHCKLSSDEAEILDKECLKHLNSWDLKTMLLVSDCWLHLGPEFKLSYHEDMTELVVNDIYYGTELTEQDVVQLFYIMRLSKTCLKVRGVYTKLLKIVTSSLNSLSWSEISNICFSMVKVKVFKEEQDRNFLNALSEKFIDGLRNKEVDMYATTGIMRCLARCYYEDEKAFDALAEYLTPIIQGGQDADTSGNYTKLHIGHVAMAFAKVRMFHKPLMDAIVDHVLYSDSRHRTKDVNLILWAFGRLHYKPEEHSDRFFQQLIQELRFKEFSKEMYPETFLGSLVSLTFLGYYPDVLINQVFSPAYLQICDEHMRKAGLDPLCRHLFTLDCSVALECPDYHGNRLPEHFIKMYKDVKHGSELHTQKMERTGRSSEIIRLLREMTGHNDYVKIRPVLPHIKTPADIEVHLDSQGKPVLPHSFQSDAGRNLTNVSIPYYKLDEFVKEAAETSNAPGIHRLAVLINTPLHYHCNSEQLLGAHVMKKRQLKKVGYTIVEIPHFEWTELNTRMAKMNYLKNKLQDACEE
ncbi:FAST kinase domain-containing protein 5, mitochondrial-like [Amphiura filiformis]|uniref:FAST kinase domain-containing protein 5, mitochondrial-like n=1 Tax=Amphiura filiformis TaxID=82378 RepID=UPI003B227E7E